ncbi:MAG: hypothetical protein HYU51_00355 [Candidatus Rokubacteria bacterium]|nr:hypothetical protein [Candidatus Rokubacteria bacterium]
METVVRDGLAPSPDAASQWALPEIAVYARGFTIDAADRIVFGATEPSRMLVPARAAPGLGDEAELARRAFFLNGLLFSTVDFEVVKGGVYSAGASGWVRASPTIRKGGYKWYLGSGGIYLLDARGNGTLISFEKPLEKAPSDARNDVELSASSGRDARVLILVAGSVIAIR